MTRVLHNRSVRHTSIVWCGSTVIVNVHVHIVFYQECLWAFYAFHINIIAHKMVCISVLCIKCKKCRSTVIANVPCTYFYFTNSVCGHFMPSTIARRMVCISVLLY